MFAKSTHKWLSEFDLFIMRWPLLILLKSYIALLKFPYWKVAALYIELTGSFFSQLVWLLSFYCKTAWTVVSQMLWHCVHSSKSTVLALIVRRGAIFFSLLNLQCSNGLLWANRFISQVVHINLDKHDLYHFRSYLTSENEWTPPTVIKYLLDLFRWCPP